MKVGVFLKENLPEIGGGYTFSSEIFYSLLKLGSESSHKFVVYGWNKKISLAVLQFKNIEYISLYSTLLERCQYNFSEVITAILKKWQQPKSNFQIEQWFTKLILNSLANNGIDITWYAGPDCLTMDLPYIITVWDLQHRLQPYFPEIDIECKWELQEQHYATKLNRASFIITGTEVGKSEIERFYHIPAERIKVLPFPTLNFVSNTVLSSGKQILQKYNLSENYLFYPAQFWPHKNHANLLLAVKYLRDKYDLTFPVVFSGSDQGNKGYIKQMVDELNLSKQVSFVGFVPQEDLISLYCNAFALTFVTFFGPDNLPPLEAFALGCPVIASNISGAEEQLGDAALLVDPKQPEEIALAIKSFWDNATLRQTFIERGLARASKWTCEDYVKGIFSLLDEFAAIRRCWKSN